jgi:hypothetical protein
MVSGWLSVPAILTGQKTSSGSRIPPAMSGARLFIAALGSIIAVAGGAAAVYFDKYLGIGMILVGGFLLTLTITKFSDTD